LIATAAAAVVVAAVAVVTVVVAVVVVVCRLQRYSMAFCEDNAAFCSLNPNRVEIIGFL